MTGPARRDVLAGVLGVSAGAAPAVGATPPARPEGRTGAYQTLIEAQRAILSPDLAAIVVDGYAEPLDHGGGVWRRSPVQSAGPGRRRFADGGWWELAEVNPTPEQFGAPMDQAADCTAALQEALDFVRANAVRVSIGGGASGRGNANQSYLQLRARRYICGELDFTTDGTLIGLGIRGAGQYQSCLIGSKVSGPWPILDCTGMPSADLRDFSVGGDADCLASCSILFARDIHAVFHNYEPYVTDVRAKLNVNAPNLISSIVVQSADLACLTRVYGERAMGYRAPPRTAGRARGAPRTRSFCRRPTPARRRSMRAIRSASRPGRAMASATPSPAMIPARRRRG